VSAAGKTIELSRSEYLLLSTLLKRADRVQTRRVLEEQVLTGSAGDSNALEVHISNIRRKIGEGYIRTVRGVGYVIDKAQAKGGV
jgi:DNA-binding response OmpR family regulator